ncbi:uncharacterized protein METZ01_LOCUS428065 [marine metagenome]|uniref:Uncharacterized protein n=1 Tax=marine metagenome TaxID=408172 RepID=A0A382XXK2_9ZZZZ
MGQTDYKTDGFLDSSQMLQIRVKQGRTPALEPEPTPLRYIGEF